jgi:single-stranded-DNA-specific exonuclease
VDENRALVEHGLRRLRETRRPGLRKLIERAGLKPLQLDTVSIGFGLAPRINAAGRTEHANFSAELLLTDDPAEASQLAEKLETFNNSRRSIEGAMLDQAIGMLGDVLGDRVIVIAQDGWHPGVLGIVASRILNLLHRPTFVIGIDGVTGKGSGRSISTFDLHAALTACEDHLVRYGGHKMAAGLTVEAERIDALRIALNAHAALALDDEAMRPVVEIDALALPGDLSLDSVALLERLAPYGQGNPRPVIALEDFRVVEDPIVMKDRHIKLRMAGPSGEPLTALGWSMSHRLDELQRYRGKIRVAGTPFINAWNGRRNVELELKDFQVG